MPRGSRMIMMSRYAPCRRFSFIPLRVLPNRFGVCRERRFASNVAFSLLRWYSSASLLLTKEISRVLRLRVGQAAEGRRHERVEAISEASPLRSNSPCVAWETSWRGRFDGSRAVMGHHSTGQPSSGYAGARGWRKGGTRMSAARGLTT